MNSYHYRKSLSNKALAALFLTSFLTAPAFAQSTAPVVEQQQGLSLPAATGQEIEKEAPPIALPIGATIDGAQDKVRSMAAEAGKSLDELIGSAVTPRSEAEIGEMAARQRHIMLLEDQVKEAKLAKQLWIEVNGEQSKQNAEEITRLQGETASLQAEIVRLTSKQLSSAPSKDPDPVVSEVTGAAGKMTAKILVPYMGEFVAERGTSLPNGMKVVDISKRGVTVLDGENRKALLFGTAVPRVRVSKTSPTVVSTRTAGSADNIVQQIGQ